MLIRVARDEELFLWSQHALYSDDGLQTSFGGFMLDSVMQPIVAFSVVKMSTQMFNVDKNVAAPLIFDTVRVDTHNGWSRSDNAFTVPTSDIYVISMTACVCARRDLKMHLVIDDDYYHDGTSSDALVFKTNGSHYGEDTVSRTFVVQLVRGSRLQASVGR
jgi:hypothetical protein